MKCTPVTGALVWLAAAVAPALAPVNTANWKADSSQRWTVPLGTDAGKIFHFGPLPVNMQLAGYYNVVTPDNGADWQVRFQTQFMFPK